MMDLDAFFARFCYYLCIKFAALGTEYILEVVLSIDNNLRRSVGSRYVVFLFFGFLGFCVIFVKYVDKTSISCLIKHLE